MDKAILSCLTLVFTVVFMFFNSFCLNCVNNLVCILLPLCLHYANNDIYLHHITITNIQNNINMQISKKIIKSWQHLKSRGDVNELKDLLKKDASTISRILSGKQESTPEMYTRISEFYTARKKQVSRIK